MRLLGSEVLFQILSEIVEIEIHLIVSKVHIRHVKLMLGVVADHGLWLLVNLWQCVNLEMSGERIVVLDDSRLS